MFGIKLLQLINNRLYSTTNNNKSNVQLKQQRFFKENVTYV